MLLSATCDRSRCSSKGGRPPTDVRAAAEAEPGVSKEEAPQAHEGHRDTGGSQMPEHLSLLRFRRPCSQYSEPLNADFPA